MKKPNIKIVNPALGIDIEREMTDEEFVNYEIELKQNVIDKKAEEQAQIKKIKEKTALLERLGITADEANLLFE